MRKKIFAALLALALTLSLMPAALAAGFADISDTATAQNVEVLRLMGVIEGDDNASFRPSSSLTRAEFCKMAVVLTGKRGVVTRYGARTVFPDVRGSHWAAGYVNYAASADAGLIHGMPDGTFQPDRAITYGEAVTILTRLLGYTDKDTGGIWPDGYLALAGEAGMTKGLSVSGGASITRAQAAKLFVNALTSENGEGNTLLAKLGFTADLTKDPVTLWSVDTVNGKIRTSGGDVEMADPMASTVLNGLKGHVVSNAAGKAITFLPVTSAAGGVVSDAAVIVSANGSAAGFSALTGGASNYKIYRNGIPVTSAALRKSDVATYNAANNTVQVTDTRVTVYYENCAPSQAAPTSVTVLGGTEFSVLPTAQQSLSKFKPGQVMVILLTADGQVAGAVSSESRETQGNALAYVDSKGVARLICGSTLKELKCSGVGHADEVVRISQSGKGSSNIHLSKQNVSADAIDVASRKLGARSIAEDAVVIDNGVVTSLPALGVSHVEKNRVVYYRAGSGGAVELIVLSDTAGNVCYGRALFSEELIKGSDTLGSYEYKKYTLSVTNKSGTTSGEVFQSGKTGDCVEALYDAEAKRFTNVTVLTRLGGVPASAWISDTAVNYDGRTYTVPSNVDCYNVNSGTWFDKLDEAKAYGGTMDLYVKDGVVRVIEVRA